MIDNFNLLREHLCFKNRDEFYFIQIIQRKKDGNEGLHVRNGFRLIKPFYIYSLEEFDSCKDRIIALCENNNARAYINMNVRNAKECALECIKRYTNLILDGNAFQGNNVWESACGSTRARGYKPLWIVDIDVPDSLETIKKIIYSCRHSDEFTLYTVPTVHGFHIICNGFDLQQFRNVISGASLEDIDIHKNNPTLLYYNDISSQSKQNFVQF